MNMTAEQIQSAIDLAHRITDGTGSIPMQFIEYWKGQVQHTDIVSLARALLDVYGRLQEAEKRVPITVEHWRAVVELSAYAADGPRLINALTGDYIRMRSQSEGSFEAAKQWHAEAEQLRAELTEARINAKCPCCKDGMALALSGQEREPCHECKGTALVAIAYETCRVHYKLQGEALTEARRQLDVARKAPCAPDCASRKAVCADCYRPTGMLGACHGFGEVVNGKVLEGAQYSSHLFPHPCNCWKSQITPTETQS